ncbi:MAG: hypothetical protein HC883_04435 [Bdellovibrionaceae bacterium]|nr:hypothetical protein [Pseudobdellovibrionaceae bacterium]
MTKIQNHPYELMAMFRVVNIQGPLLTLCCWDLDDKIIPNVYLGEQPDDPEVDIGSVHLMNLVLSGGLWRVTFCSPAYEEVDNHFCEDED